MRVFIAMTKKEFLESIRTYKLLLVAAVFLLFGMLNPVTAKIMPKLLSAFMPEGMTITPGEPGTVDSWIQFYKNMSTQLILFIIVFSGIMSNELNKGTLINMLTKGLPRKTVILSKFTATTSIWTVSYLICFVITLLYTMYLLPGKLPNLIFAASCMWLFGVLEISMMLLGGVLSGRIYGALLLAGGFTGVLMLANIFPKFEEYNPYLLSTGCVSLLTSERVPSDFYISITVTIVFILLMIISSICSFNKKQI